VSKRAYVERALDEVHMVAMRRCQQRERVLATNRRLPCALRADNERRPISLLRAHR
jgi:hypothetical protein